MKLKITKMGNSLGIILPDELLRHLRIAPGDTLDALKTANGVVLTRFDPEFARQTAAAISVMRENRRTLRNLAR